MTIRETVSGGVRGAARQLSGLTARTRPDAGNTPPWDRTILDDVAMRRPWNIRLKAERQWALWGLSRLVEGVTVIVVNWNTKDVTADVVRAVQELSSPAVRVLVVDNGSTDGSRELFARWPGIDTILLRSNAGHGVALDLALYRVRTTVAVTLDSDALPLHRSWLEPAVDPIQRGDAVLSGLRSSRSFVHPVYLAVATASFVRRRLSFQTFVPAGVSSETAVWGSNAWDTAESMTGRLLPSEVNYVDPTPNLVPDLPGMTAGGVVYHHGGVSRGAAGRVDQESLRAWRDACARLRSALGRDAPQDEAP